MLIPRTMWGITFPEVVTTRNEPGAGFHLQPHYRTRRPLEATLLKAQAGLDDFITEKFADQIATILAEWSADLLQSPLKTQAIARVLAEDFSAGSLQAADSRVVRSRSTLDVRESKFSTGAALNREGFLREWRSAFRGFSRILTAEFQITGIELATAEGMASSSALQKMGGVRTRVRYEMVGSGAGFHREQRVGHWDLAWEPSSSGAFQVRSWRVLDETQARSRSPIYCGHQFGSARQYFFVLGAIVAWHGLLAHRARRCIGIDIYGHNGVSVADIDKDGFDDLYVCQPAGLPNRLYRNRGDGTLEDITESSGLGILENTACALFADFNNNGRQDVIVVRANGPLLFLNEGGGKFRQKADAFQFAGPPQGTFTGAAVADYDRDGWLDIYFCLYALLPGYRAIQISFAVSRRRERAARIF